jgi:E3 ubiquitin-protein ligase RGLG
MLVSGKHSFKRQSMHDIGSGLNPYEQAISIIGKTLAAFDDDNLIPCFGFGDSSTHDEDVFSFYPDGRFCNGFDDVLSRYREIVPNIRLAGGPRSFAPIVEMATKIVERRGGQYHVLVIISNGQVRHSVTCSARLNYVPMSVVELIL